VALERAQLGLTAAIAATCLVSIFAAQVLLAGAAVVLIARLLLRRGRLPRTALDGPVLTFCVWTLLSASFSPNPVDSHENAKKLVLFLVLYLAVEALSEPPSREAVLDSVALSGLVLAGGTLLQFYVLGFNTLDNRPRSFLGHYMTASGLSMSVLVLAAARLAFRPGPWPSIRLRDLAPLGWISLALAALGLLQKTRVFAIEGERVLVAGLAVAAATSALIPARRLADGAAVALSIAAMSASAWALVLSRTRGAWLGALAGLAVVAVLRAPRTLWLLTAAVAALLLARPGPIMDRLTVTDASSRDRYYMWQAGIDMILEKPIFGQGPGQVERVYPGFRWPEAPNPRAPHLHDNAVQIAAERGLPGLVFWIWMMVAAMGDACRLARRGPERDAGVAGLSVLTAVMVAGAFEYNFGDSEVLMFVLIVAALPYAVLRGRETAA
jgi:O-antigen ligase